MKSIFLLFAAAAVAAPPLHAAEVSIDMTLLRNPTGADECNPHGINASGDISGSCWYGETLRGFLWHRATDEFTLFDLGAQTFTYAAGLNDAGMLVGDYVIDTVSWERDGFFYDAQTGVVSSDPLHRLRGISNAGDLTGSIRQADGTVIAYRDWNGQQETFSCLGSANTVGEGINVAGDVVGQTYGDQGFRSFLYHDGVCTDITYGPLYTQVWSINDRRDIVGGYFIASSSQCYYGGLFRHDGRVDTTRTECNPHVPLADRVAMLFGINNARVVTGLTGDGRMFYGPIRGALGDPH